MKIAIIGSGISGLGVAYLLNPQHDISVFEKNSYIGGHSRTVEIQVGEKMVPVDTGFIVFNHRSYPHLTALFERLEVPTAKSNMSFGISVDNGWLEYSTKSLLNLFAQKHNLLRLPFWRMLYDILKFNRHARTFLANSASVSLGEYLDEVGLRSWFRQYYLLAMGSAIWSTPLDEMLNFPAQTFVRFFDNHGLLTVSDQPQWYTVVGGSKEYVKRLSQSFCQKIHLDCAVERVRRDEKDGIVLQDSQGRTHQFDSVVFACHTDEALQILEQPTALEQDILGSIRYQYNDVILHSDTSFMPQRRQAWSSWNYLSDRRRGQGSQVSLSYWMNSLQPLKTNMPIIVTLNPGRTPDPAKTYDRCRLSHPVFDRQSIVAQQRLPMLQGNLNTWYCGAWTQYGFHEDGLLSAVNVAQAMGVQAPWN